MEATRRQQHSWRQQQGAGCSTVGGSGTEETTTQLEATAKSSSIVGGNKTKGTEATGEKHERPNAEAEAAEATYAATED